MIHGTHNAEPDERNEDILIYVNGEMLPRSEAKISVFDSGYLVGDGIWEGMRLYDGKLAFVDLHLDRLWDGAASIGLKLCWSKAELEQIVYGVLLKNAMHTDVHVRVMVTRGIKKTPSQDPRLTILGPNLVVIAEHKKASTETTGADEALMLDTRGFVSTCNATNFFIVRNGEVITSTGAYCMNGITRHNVIRICKDNGLICHLKDFSLFDVYGADEAFVTGSFGGLIPVTKIDGREIGIHKGPSNPITLKLSKLYKELICQ